MPTVEAMPTVVVVVAVVVVKTRQCVDWNLLYHGNVMTVYLLYFTGYDIYAQVCIVCRTQLNFY
jgi:hypothetical protein